MHSTYVLLCWVVSMPFVFGQLCSITPTDSQNFEYIGSVSVNGNTVSSGPTSYSDFTNTVLDTLQVDSTYTLEMAFPVSQQGFNNVAYNDQTGDTTSLAYTGGDVYVYISVWIDLNHNSVLDYNEQVFTSLENLYEPVDTVEVSLSVPNCTTNGLSHMRVTVGVDVPNPCGQVISSEAEDYLLYIAGSGMSPPTSSDIALSIAEDGSHAFMQSDFPYMDMDGNPFAKVLLRSLPTRGSMAYNGVVLTGLREVLVAYLGLLRYTPPADAAGMDYVMIDFLVEDCLGYQSVPYGLSVHVLEVNDPPILSDALVEVDELPPNGLILDTLEVVDVDDTLFAFSITAQPIAGALSVDDAGVVRVLDGSLLHYSRVQQLEVDILVQDDSLAISMGRLTVQLRDVLHAPSLVSDSVWVKAFSLPVVVDTLRALDADFDAVRFSLLGSGGSFGLDTLGVLRVIDGSGLDFRATTPILEVLLEEETSAGLQSVVRLPVRVVRPTWSGVGVYSVDIGHWNIGSAPLDSTDWILVSAGELHVRRSLVLQSVELRNAAAVRVAGGFVLEAVRGITVVSGRMELDRGATLLVHRMIERHNGTTVSLPIGARLFVHGSTLLLDE